MCYQHHSSLQGEAPELFQGNPEVVWLKARVACLLLPKRG